MWRCFIFKVIASTLAAIQSVAFAGPTLSLDAGTSFSPHGVGGSIGYFSDEQLLSIEIGSGSSKNRVAGIPLSLETRAYSKALFDSYLVFFGIGGSYYQGSGQRDVVFASHTKEGNTTIKSGANWKFLYARSNFGLMSRSNLFSYPMSFFADAGFAWAAYSKVNADFGNFDQSNVGESIGISTGGAFDYGYMGYKDWGPYLRVGVTAHVFN